MARKTEVGDQISNQRADDECYNLAETLFYDVEDEVPIPLNRIQSKTHTSNSDSQGKSVMFSKSRLISLQESDPELNRLLSSALSEKEAETVPVCYFKSEHGVLMRKWRHPEVPADEWGVIYQIVVPPSYRAEIMKVAHDLPMSGHLGVRKTQDRIMRHFFWPKLHKDVSQFCQTCHTCQIVGKSNQKIPVAPLIPIPACGQPFDKVIIDCVGPLPKTRSGHMYLLTIMDVVTRYPEAIPLRNITAKEVSEALVKFFTRMGLPKVVQHDQGSNFTSNLFKQVLQSLGITQITSSAYHPQSQGVLERYHQTLKSMIRKFCHDRQDDWDKGVDFLLFATRETPCEGTGFSPFELVFGHDVRGPLKFIKEKFLSPEPESETNILDYVSDVKERMYAARDIAQANLAQSQKLMKTRFDKDSRDRTFDPGDQVLVLLPIQGEPLRAKFSGPYQIEKKLNSVNYVVKTPDRKKSRRVCHVNMLTKYHVREAISSVVAIVDCEEVDEMHIQRDSTLSVPGQVSAIMSKNSEVLSNLSVKLEHLSKEKQAERTDLLFSYECLSTDIPGRTSVLFHDVDVSEVNPIKQHPYRLNPLKLQTVRDEVNYMLKNDIISPSQSPWSSPVLLVPKEDGSQRFCIDYRKVNSVTKTDSFPIPRLDDCIDRIGHATYVSKYDLLKGYWQVPLTKRAQ